MNTTTPSSASWYMSRLWSAIIPHPLHSSSRPQCLYFFPSLGVSVQAARGTLRSAGVDIADDAWANAFAYHLARCCGDASVHTAHSRLMTTLADIISEVLGWRRGSSSPAVSTASLRMWVSFTTTACEAQNLLLMPWFPVCSAFIVPCPPISLYAVLRRPSSRSTQRG
jgi:hypothetical protein